MLIVTETDGSRWVEFDELSGLINKLKKFEEVLRLAPRKNHHSGLYIELEDVSIIAFTEFIREFIAKIEDHA